MITVIPAPQVDVNDDNVTVSEIRISVGDWIEEDTELATVETLKTSVEIAAHRQGYIRRILVELQSEINVGTPMFLIADTMEEEISKEILRPEDTNDNKVGTSADSIKVTAKAQVLAKKHGVEINQVTARNGRIGTEEVLRYLNTPLPVEATISLPIPHHARKMSNVESGILRTLQWHKNEAISAYVETVEDLASLVEFSAYLKSEKKWLFDPLFPIIAWCYVQYISSHPELNSICYNHQIVQYEPVNLGFTIDVNGELFLPVLRNADQFDQMAFVEAFFSLQRRAMKKRLAPDEMTGSTIGITSLASLGITKHQPTLRSTPNVPMT